jgi:hypothetical protein
MEQSGIFSLVVGLGSEAVGFLINIAIRPDKDERVRRLAGVSPRGAIGVGDPLAMLFHRVSV